MDLKTTASQASAETNSTEFGRNQPLESPRSKKKRSGTAVESSDSGFRTPTALQVLVFVLRPGFHSAAFLAHLSSGIDAIRIANLHFILLCVSIQQWIFAIFICSIAAAVLLFMYSIHSSCSISTASISSSVSFMKEMSMSWSQSEFESYPSSVSSSEHSLFSLSSLLTCVFYLYFLFVCTMRRSILRCVDCIIFSCSFERVHVREA